MSGSIKGAPAPAKRSLVADNPDALLAELRNSQAKVAGNVEELIAALGETVRDVQKGRTIILAEQQRAIEAIQTKLDIAIASIRAISRQPVDADDDEFRHPSRLGGYQEYP